MLTNQYTSFGNDMLSKYAGMVSAINPLSLFYLKNETQEEAPALQQAPSITYVQNQIHKVNHHHYHTMANRYMINYQNTMNLIASNPVYQSSPNFRKDLLPASLVHAKPEKSEDEKREETKEIVKSLVKQVVSEYKESIVKETDERTQIRNFLSVLSETPQLQQRILPVLERNIQTIWIKHEKESEKEIVREMTVVLEQVMEQAAQKMPDQYRKMLSVQKGQNLRMQTENLVTRKEVEWVAQTLTKRLTQEILEKKTIRETKVLENVVRETKVLEQRIQETRERDAKVWGTVQKRPLITQKLQAPVQSKQRAAKEKFQTQVMGRIAPLPVRPVSYVFPKEKADEQEIRQEVRQEIKQETNNAVIQQKVNYVMKKETAAEYKYYTHILEKFLHKDEKNQTQMPDRRQMPAGIIWHEKPKANVTFERREILQVPMHLVYDKQQVPQTVNEQNGEQQTGVNTQTTAEKQVTVEKQMVAGKPVTVEKTQSFVSSPVSHTEYNEYIDYQTRQIIRKAVPDFTNTTKQITIWQNGSSQPALQSAAEAFSYTWKNGMLELVLPRQNAAMPEESGTALLQQMVMKPEVYRERIMSPANLHYMQNVQIAADNSPVPQGSLAATGQYAAIQMPIPVMEQGMQGTTAVQLQMPAQGTTSAPMITSAQVQASAQGQGSVPHPYGAQQSQAAHPGMPTVAQVAPVAGQSHSAVGFIMPEAFSMPGAVPQTPAAAGGNPQGQGLQSSQTAAQISQMTTQISQVATQISAAAVQSAIQNVQPQVAPVSLVYKSENGQNTKQQQEIKKIEEKTEFLEDIVFEKKIVSKDTKYKYNTIHETQEQTQQIDQISAGSPVFNGSSVVSRAEVDGIVSESVSRHVDENISRISKQVYKDIERQLKKERERRGLK